jgi:solute carrier family 35 protein C2
MGGVEGEAVSGADDAAGLDSDSDETLHDDEEMGLTNTDRQRRRTKKRRNTQLDQRIARENISAEEKREADQNVAKRLLINASLIGLWYLFSLCISLVSGRRVPKTR